MKIIWYILQGLKILMIIVLLPFSLLIMLAGLFVVATEVKTYEEFRENLGEVFNLYF